jgi:hypothetical protein
LINESMNVEGQVMEEKAVVNKVEMEPGILAAEFEYIAQTAFQANEDRARASEFFLISFGTLLAAVLTTQFTEVDARFLYRLFIILFSVVAVWGALTILQLCRLRQAWLESVRAMNTIKDAMIDKSPAMQDYFRWRTPTIPKAYKPWSVGFLLALQVAMVSGVAMGAVAALGILLAGREELPWLWVSTVALLTIIAFLVGLYYLPLRKNDRNK